MLKKERKKDQKKKELQQFIDLMIHSFIDYNLPASLLSCLFALISLPDHFDEVVVMCVRVCVHVCVCLLY